MKKTIRLTESDLTNIIQRIINEENTNKPDFNKFADDYIAALLQGQTGKGVYTKALEQFRTDYNTAFKYLVSKMTTS